MQRSLAKKIKRASAIILTAAAIAGCAQDEGSQGIINPPVNPPSQPIPLVTETITRSSGGTISSNGYEIVIPPLALSQDATVSMGSPTSITEITNDGAQRISLPLEVNFGTSLQDTINIRFPLSSVTDGVLGIAQTSSGTALESLYVYQGKAEFQFPPNQQDNQESFSLKTFVINLPKMVQSAQLNTRGVNTSSPEKVALLIHGFGSSPQVFNDPVLPLLNELYNNRVMTFQYPSGLHISTNISTLESKINTLGDVPFTWDIVAHSMGGLVARGYARDHPDAIDKLVTLGTPHQGIQSQFLLHSFAESVINLHLSDVFFNPFSKGAEDIVYASTFMGQINLPDVVNAKYYLISGNRPYFISTLIPGDDDGLVTVTSAELGNLEDRLGGGGYEGAESVTAFERHRVTVVHTDLTQASEVAALLRTILAGPPNNPPTAPIINPATPTEGRVGEAIGCAVVSTDPETNQICYRWVWSYADTSAWSTLAPSGITTLAMHTYTNPGYYTIRAQAKDEHGSLSTWSNPPHHIIITSEPESYVVTLQPGPEGIDTQIYDASPDQNYGTLVSLWASTYNGSTDRRSLIQFDLSSIPSNATVTSSTLSLYGEATVFEGDPLGDISNVSLYKILSPWNEGSVTWNNQPTTDASPLYTRTIYEAGHDEWHTFTITSLVDSWIRRTVPNYGLELKQNPENKTRIFAFWSSDAINKPKLEITYTLP